MKSLEKYSLKLAMEHYLPLCFWVPMESVSLISSEVTVVPG